MMYAQGEEYEVKSVYKSWNTARTQVLIRQSTHRLYYYQLQHYDL
jgi:hypothetical protein